MTLVAYGASVRGPSHDLARTPNQDALGLSGCRGGCFLAVCDGLGSHAMSDAGSRAMVVAAKKVLCRDTRPADPGYWPELLHTAWKAELHGVAPGCAGTTCLVAQADKLGRVAYAQLGDGVILIRSAGETRIVSPQRTGFGNETSALAEHHQPEKWVTGEVDLPKIGDGLLLMTDGVSDDLREEALPSFFDFVQRRLCSRSRRSGKRWLQQQLWNWPVPMHGDDKTIAAAFRVNR